MSTLFTCENGRVLFSSPLQLPTRAALSRCTDGIPANNKRRSFRGPMPDMRCRPRPDSSFAFHRDNNLRILLLDVLAAQTARVLAAEEPLCVQRPCASSAAPLPELSEAHRQTRFWEVGCTLTGDSHCTPLWTETLLSITPSLLPKA